MELTHEEFQKARRISKEIQSYLESINADGLRSTDLYPILARKNLIEKDKENGLHFRRFLHRLMDLGVLGSLIPQCKPQKNLNNNSFTDWYFYRVYNKDKEPQTVLDKEPRDIKMPELSDVEIDELIKEWSPEVDKLPKRNLSDFDYPKLDTRKSYARAYEIWTSAEIHLMTRAYNKFKKIDKVASLLKRQPSAVKRKLEELNLIK
ncbi:MAG: hypothetical protein LUH10_13440 [Tannerellaceae bacterium]|nr:hypothetical protein [Tannerellaceae bacterium]